MNPKDPQAELREAIESIILPYTSVQRTWKLTDQVMELFQAHQQELLAELKQGWTIQLPDLPYFQIECTGTTADRYWKSTIYETKNLPAILFTEENSKRYREGL